MESKEDCNKLIKLGKIMMGNSTIYLEKCRDMDGDYSIHDKVRTPKNKKKNTKDEKHLKKELNQVKANTK
jgi:hypothetical protein